MVLGDNYSNNKLRKIEVLQLKSKRVKSKKVRKPSKPWRKRS